jgi:hypothetical protein
MAKVSSENEMQGLLASEPANGANGEPLSAVTALAATVR